MRYLLFITFFVTNTILQAQSLRPNSIFASYFGETITHPGLKIGLTYQLKNWDKTKTKKNGTKTTIQRSLDLNPSIGFFYHRAYQTGIFILPELSYTTKKANGNFLVTAIGCGYMRTILPNVYDLNSNGEIKKINVGYNYFLSSYALIFGKDLSVKKNIPISIFLKPQILYALPNATKGVSYFAFELGVSYKLTKKN